MTEYYDNGKVKVQIFEPEYNFVSSYSFNVGYAEKYGVNEAIFLQNMIFWIQNNIANDKNYYDDYYWTYNSMKAYTIIFPFWTEKQIRYIIETLEKKNIIKSGNYNKSAYDRTKWYTIIDETICENSLNHLPKKANQLDKKVEPIPDINTYIKPDIKTTSIATSNDVAVCEKKDSNFRSVKWNKIIEYYETALEESTSKKIVNWKPNVKALKDILKIINKHITPEIFDQAVYNNRPNFHGYKCKDNYVLYRIIYYLITKCSQIDYLRDKTIEPKILLSNINTVFNWSDIYKQTIISSDLFHGKYRIGNNWANDISEIDPKKYKE